MYVDSTVIGILLHLLFYVQLRIDGRVNAIVKTYLTKKHISHLCYSRFF